jgi:hypothetical protein
LRNGATFSTSVKKVGSCSLDLTNVDSFMIGSKINYTNTVRVRVTRARSINFLLILSWLSTLKMSWMNTGLLMNNPVFIERILNGCTVVDLASLHNI